MPQSGMHRAVVYMIKYNNNMFNSYGQSKNVRLSAKIVQFHRDYSNTVIQAPVGKLTNFYR